MGKRWKMENEKLKMKDEKLRWEKDGKMKDER